MTDNDRLIFKDRVQSLALSLLQNATVQATITDDGVALRIEFVGLGSAVLCVPRDVARRNDALLCMWLSIEIGYLLRDLCREKYCQK